MSWNIDMEIILPVNLQAYIEFRPSHSEFLEESPML